MKAKLLFAYYKLLGFLAHHYLTKHHPRIIGINGSVGKTSCRMIVYQTLCTCFPHLTISTSQKNFNGELGLSLSIFEIKQRSPTLWSFVKTLGIALWKVVYSKKPYDIIILEYGIDRPQEMDFLLSIARPHIGVFTALDAVHSEQFGDPAAIAKEEVKMVKNTREIVFLNNEDPYALAVHNHLKVDVLMYQTQDTAGDISFSDPILSLHHGLPSASTTISLRGKTYPLTTNLLGKENFGYIGISLAIAEIINKGKAISLPHHMEYQLQPGRLSVFQGAHESILIDSSYNAAPLSMRKIIGTSFTLRNTLYKNRPFWLVLGDMRELGDLTEKEHRLLAGYVSQVADRVFLVGEQMTTHMADELEKIGYNMTEVYKFHCSRSLGTILKKMLKDIFSSEGETPLIVFKGSQNTIFLEEAIKQLLQNPEDEQYLPRQGSWWMKRKGC